MDYVNIEARQPFFLRSAMHIVHIVHILRLEQPLSRTLFLDWIDYKKLLEITFLHTLLEKGKPNRMNVYFISSVSKYRSDSLTM